MRSRKAKEFIFKQISEIVKYNIVAFIKIPNLKDSCYGTLRVNPELITTFGLELGCSYEIYLKLHSHKKVLYTRLILCKIK